MSLILKLKLLSFRDVLFWTALKPDVGIADAMSSFRDVLFWTALKPNAKAVIFGISFRDVLFWTALKLEFNLEIEIIEF